MSQYIDMNRMYGTNKDMERYVDRYMTKERIDLQTALSHKIVRNYAEYLLERGKSETVLPNMWSSAGAAHENMADI